MRIVLTGASGFIGQHVLRALKAQGIEPYVVCRNNTPSGVSEDHIISMDLHALPPDPFEVMGRPDLLIHMAWGGLPNYRSLYHVVEEAPAHVRFLSTMVHSGLKKLVVTGTCFEYGMIEGELREDLPTNPQNPYGLAKDYLRCTLEMMRVPQTFDFTWARLFYTHGPGQAQSSLLPQLERAIAASDLSFPMSGGEQLRDFMPVERLAENLVALALTQGHHGVVNLCSGQPISVQCLVKDRLEALGAEIELHFGAYPYPDYEPMAFWGNRDKMVRILSKIV
jgi:nucleoside-diphosphate-sugar epimerase